MLIVGIVSSPQEAHEIESVVKVFVVACRVKYLAMEVKK